MDVIWNYLDKRKATIDALADFNAMQFIIDSTDEKIQEKKEQMIGLGAVNMDGMPHAHNVNAGEDRMNSAIDHIDVLKERYRQALEYMAWFKPAWDKLSEDEKFTLTVYYIRNDDSYSGIPAICDHFCVEKSAAYNRKNKAVEKLATLLYGK